MYNPNARFDSPTLNTVELSDFEKKGNENRTAFFSECIAKYPELTDVQRDALRKAIVQEKGRSWSEYDGQTVKISKLDIAEGKITIVFEKTTEDEFDADNIGEKITLSEIVIV